MRSICLIVALALMMTGCGDQGGIENTMASVDDLPAEGPAPPPGPQPGVREPSRIFCPEIGERATEEECEDVNALKADVRPGAAALDVPNPMIRGRNAQVTLIIDRRPLSTIRKVEAENAMDAEVENSIAEAENVMEARDDAQAPTPGQAVGDLPGQDYAFRSQIGRYMRASLAGQGFKVRLLSPELPLQEVPAGGNGTWIWEVTPGEGGQRSLTVRTEALAKIGDRVVSLGNSQTSKTVKVEVRTIDSVRDFLTALPDWLKLITTVLVAAAALVAAWFGLRKAMRQKEG